ncbi:merozoite surface protein CMZ-8-like [Aricia agestis]|uniref:merozoite surface protein CMZ-8-like n=1 Tax=Aricia agestis TaxID=91739 RepID=UPI001C206ED6|nr:merozoite surface protein CMZ-8-like [Aricia agestis]
MFYIAILTSIGVLIEAQIIGFVSQLEPLIPYYKVVPEVKLPEEIKNLFPSTLPLPVPVALPSMPEVAPLIVPGVVSSMPEVVPSMPDIVPSSPELMPPVPKLVASVPETVPPVPEAVPSVPVVAPAVPVAAPSVPMYLPFSIYFENEKGPPCPPCMCQPACTPAFFSYCSPCHQICRCRLENLISQQVDWSCGVKVPC